MNSASELLFSGEGTNFRESRATEATFNRSHDAGYSYSSENCLPVFFGSVCSLYHGYIIHCYISAKVEFIQENYRREAEQNRQGTVKSLTYLISFFATFPVSFDLFRSYLTSRTEGNVALWFSSVHAKISCSIVPGFYVIELATSKPGLDIATLELLRHHFPVLVFILIMLFSSSSWSSVEYYVLLSETVIYCQYFSFNFSFFGLHAYGDILPNSRVKANIFMLATIGHAIVSLLTYFLLWA